MSLDSKWKELVREDKLTNAPPQTLRNLKYTFYAGAAAACLELVEDPHCLDILRQELEDTLHEITEANRKRKLERN